VKCHRCGELIYSRARHDFHYCHCGSVAVDGGRDYLKVTANDGEWSTQDLTLAGITEKELFDDWNERRDEHGWIK
jgi:hypothetical protein